MTLPTVTPEQMTAWRRAAGLRRVDLARELGVTDSAIRNWEKGRAFRPITQLAIAAYFGRLPDADFMPTPALPPTQPQPAQEAHAQ